MKVNIGRRTKALAVIGTLSAAATVLAGAGPAQAASSASYAASICGSGYWSIGSHSLAGGTIYVSYDGSTDCAVLIKTVDVGTPTETWVYIALDSSGTGGYGGNDGPRDDGNFSAYAGPVYVYAPSTCIEYAGGTVLNDDEYRSQPSFCN
jgi:hypothetical protein